MTCAPRHTIHVVLVAEPMALCMPSANRVQLCPEALSGILSIAYYLFRSQNDHIFAPSKCAAHLKSFEKECIDVLDSFKAVVSLQSMIFGNDGSMGIKIPTYFAVSLMQFCLFFPELST